MNADGADQKSDLRHPRLSAANLLRWLSTAGDSVKSNEDIDFPWISPGWTTRRCQPQATNHTTNPNKTHTKTTGTLVVNVMLVAKLQRIASTVEQTNLMKANTKKNLTSVVMLAILSPFLSLAILVSIKTLGMMNNEALLLMLTLLSAVLSGINGFGRRTATAVQLSPANAKANGADPSTVSVMFAGLSK
jgi:hypothetical protein